MAKILEYLFNEAASGTTPTHAIDSGPNASNLAIAYGSGGAVFASNSEGRGLNITAAPETSAARIASLISAAAATALNSKKTLTLLLKHGGTLVGGYDARFAFDLCDNTTRFLAFGRDGTGIFNFEMSGRSGIGFYNSSPYTFISIDSTQALVANRIKVYGYASGAIVPISLDGGGPADADFPQNTQLSGISNSTCLLSLMGRVGFPTANAQGNLKYIAMVDVALTSSDLAAIGAALTITDDVSPFSAALAGDAAALATAAAALLAPPVINAGIPTVAQGASPTLGATTDQPSGTIRFVLSQTASDFTGISEPQILAGQNAAGSPASKFTAAITVSNTSPAGGVTGLAPGTWYVRGCQQLGGFYSNILSYSFVVSDTALTGNAAAVANAPADLTAPAVTFLLRDIDSGLLKNAVTYANIHVFASSNRATILKSFTNRTTDVIGNLVLRDPLLVAGTSYDGVGFSADGSDRFHATAIAADLGI